MRHCEERSDELGITIITVLTILHEERSDEFSAAFTSLLIFAISITNTLASLAAPRYARRSSEQALTKLMTNAQTTQDVLNVEKQLRNVINQKESNVQQKNYYEKSR